MKRILNFFKGLFFQYYITCTSTIEAIRVYSEEDLEKQRFCPFCGLPMRKRNESDEEYNEKLRKQIQRLERSIS